MNLSLKAKWTISIAVSVGLSLLILGFFTLSITKQQLKTELLNNVEQNLTSQRVLVKSKIDDYFSTIENQLLVMAKSEQTIQATKSFASAFYQYENQYEDSKNRSDVKGYYDKEFGRVYAGKNDANINSAQLIAPLSERAAALQADYIARNKFELGAKDSLNATGSGQAYDDAHGQYHPDFASFVNTFGYYDLFIVDAEQGNVIYSVFKEVDFATNLNDGSFKLSGLANAFKQGAKISDGEFFLTDFESYKPSYEAPAGFISTPIYDGSRLLAVLIYQMPIDTINQIMIQNAKWVDNGFGESGEVYLVGADETLRSESRFYVESPSAYGDLMKSLNVPEIDKILSQETTVTIQNVNSSSAKQALSGNSGFDIIEDYRGVKVLSSYSPVVFGNLKWAILAEIDEEEAFSSINELEKTMTTSTLAGVVVLTTVFSILSMILAAKLIKPLVEIGEYFKKLNSGSADLTYAIPDSPTPEVNAISHSFNTFVNRLREIIDEVKSNSLIVASASEELSVSTGQSSNAAQEQLKQAKDVKEAIREFSLSIESVSEHSQNASEGMSDAKLRTAEDRDLSAKASDNINKLVAEVNESASTIAHLKDEVQNINDVLVVINGIADQTNLLALNAAIEAARAGEHGRGFSVVADEVRTLASSTQKSTIDIQDKIKTLTTVAENAVNSMERASNSATQGVELVESVSSGLNNISKNIESLATINHQVATASGEQKTASQIINANVGKVSDASEQLSGAALESKQAAQELANVSNNLQQLVSGFKTINE